MRSLILAGGAGTRLQDALGATPKPMAPIDGRPFLSHLLGQIRRDGLRDVVILTGHGADAIEGYFGNGRSDGLDIAYSRESAPLGTGGALRLAASRFPGERYLVMNGDSFFDIPLDLLVDAHVVALRDDIPVRVTLALAEVADTSRYGRVQLAANGAVTSFAEKDARARSGLINAGIAVFEADVLAAIPAGRPVSLEREVLPGLVGHGLRGLALDGDFADIGTPEAYAAVLEAPDALTRISTARRPC